MNSYDLNGRIAIVTGAGQGIGLTVAERMLDSGASVSVWDIDQKLLDALEQKHGKSGKLQVLNANIGQLDAVERAVKATLERFKKIDILINNAAITYFMPVVEFTEKRFKLMLEVQVYAPFHLSQLILPSMKARKSGWIVNISSPAGLDPKPPYAPGARGGTVYGMCKAALERFSTGLASEVFEDGIAVNVVSPGLVDTPGVAVHGLINERTKDRVQPIEYIAEAVFQLASGDPKSMTGRIDYAEAFLKEFGIAPAALVA